MAEARAQIENRNRQLFSVASYEKVTLFLRALPPFFSIVASAVAESWLEARKGEEEEEEGEEEPI